MRKCRTVITMILCAVLGSLTWWVAAQNVATPANAPMQPTAQTAAVVTVPGMPGVSNANNLYGSVNLP
jgi:hypothetical protein